MNMYSSKFESGKHVSNDVVLHLQCSIYVAMYIDVCNIIQHASLQLNYNLQLHTMLSISGTIHNPLDIS